MKTCCCWLRRNPATQQVRASLRRKSSTKPRRTQHFLQAGRKAPPGGQPFPQPARSLCKGLAEALDGGSPKVCETGLSTSLSVGALAALPTSVRLVRHPETVPVFVGFFLAQGPADVEGGSLTRVALRGRSARCAVREDGYCAPPTGQGGADPQAWRWGGFGGERGRGTQSLRGRNSPFSTRAKMTPRGSSLNSLKLIGPVTPGNSRVAARASRILALFSPPRSMARAIR